MPRTIYASVKCLLVPGAAALFLLLAAPPARAASFQTFVSVNGSDSNTSASCVRTSPCRLINTALSVTSPGGVLTVLDSGGFGGFMVTQSVQVVAAPGVQATIVPIPPLSHSSLNVVIDAPDASVTLRGLYLASPGPGSQIGILVDNVRTLRVENCIVAGFGNTGIVMQFTPASSAAELFVSDTVVRECHNGILVGNIGDNPSRPIRAMLERVRVENSGNAGLFLYNNVDVVARDSVVSGNGYGILASNELAATKAEVIVEDCLVTGNIIGIDASALGGQAVVDVEGTTIAFNTIGLSPLDNGFINSRKDNTLRRNQTNGTFSTIYTPQ